VIHPDTLAAEVIEIATDTATDIERAPEVEPTDVPAIVVRCTW
jgi:hypothetical protein